MAWFSEDRVEVDGRAGSVLLDEAAAVVAGSARQPRSRRVRRVLPTRIRHAALGREDRSLTDARARIAADLPRDRQNLQVRGVPVALLLSDVLALLMTALVSSAGATWTTVFSLLALGSRAGFRQFRPRLHLSVLDDIPRTVASALSAVALTLVLLYAVGARAADGGIVRLAVWFVVVALTFETATLTVARRLRRRPGRGGRTLVVGAGNVGTRLVEALQEHPELGLRPVGYADTEVMHGTGHLSLPVLCDELGQLGRTIREHGIDTTVLAFSGTRESEVVDTVIAAHQTGCAIMVVPRMFELHHDGPGVERVRGIPLLRLRPDPTLRLSWWVKRAGDTAVAVVALVLLAPVLAVLAGLVLLDSGRPVLFWQERVGLDGRTFRLCKFRSLRPATEAESQTRWNIADDPRLTRVGRFLRTSSLDEVPQLWNILRGQMSLVGPRPERPSFVQRFSDEHERYWARHRVPVGLTGLAQVNGLRGDTSIRERARYDNYYIANWSLWLDVKILLLTVREVVGGGGR